MGILQNKKIQEPRGERLNAEPFAPDLNFIFYGPFYQKAAISVAFCYLA